jgi:hypothetical protein
MVNVPLPLSVTDPFKVGLPTSALIQLIWALALVAQRAHTPSETVAQAARHLWVRALRIPGAEINPEHRLTKEVTAFIGVV